jgi:hypothetical protein
LESYKKLGTDLSLAELIETAGEKCRCDINKCINYNQQWKHSIAVPTYEKNNKTGPKQFLGNTTYELRPKFYQTSFTQP